MMPRNTTTIKTQGLYEPRPQVALPESPPLTPPTGKEPRGFSASIHRAAAPPAHDSSRTFDLSDSAERGPVSGMPSHRGMVGLGLGIDDSDVPSHKLSTAYESKEKYGATAGPALSALGTKLYFLPRVPRRMRPALILATALFAFILVAVSRSVTPNDQINKLVRERSSAAALFGRRIPDSNPNAVVNIRDQEYLNAPDAEAEVPRQRPVYSYVPRPASKPVVRFQSTEDELLALIGFITGSTGASLPPRTDPTEVLDMSTLVGFDPAAQGAAQDLELLKEEVNAQSPLVVFGRLRDPWHHEVIKQLDQWDIVPAPLIVEVDQRPDADIFIPTLERLLGTAELPQLILLGAPLGDAHEVLALKPGELRKTLESSGAMTVKDPKKKKKNMERERQHRILAPDPIVDADEHFHFG